jgi:hypothetical protein
MPIWTRGRCSPRGGAFGVVVKGRDAAITLALLRGSQLNLFSGKSVPQLANEIEAFFRAQARNVERGTWTETNPFAAARRGFLLWEWKKCSGEGSVLN